MTAIDQLITGHRRYRDGYYEANKEQLLDLAHLGQSPRVAVVACCDSRVDPAIITDCNAGELFVIRNVANLVPSCEDGHGAWHGTSAALQFAVCHLKVEHIIVMGHARCGGIQALLEGGDEKAGNDFIAAWMSIAEQARQRTMARDDLHTLDERAHACECDAISISLANLQTFPWIAERVAQNKLQLHGWYYDVMSGELLQLDEAGKGFVSL